MSDLGEQFESTLIEESEDELQSAEDGEGTHDKRLSRFISIYISSISLLVAIAALLAAFAADDWMQEQIDGLSDRLDRNRLHTNVAMHQTVLELAKNQGTEEEPHAQRVIRESAKELEKVEAKIAQANRESRIFNTSHYTLAVGITLFQLATALAAVVGITGHHQLLYVSAAFAIVGLIICAAGVYDFML